MGSTIREYHHPEASLLALPFRRAFHHWKYKLPRWQYQQGDIEKGHPFGTTLMVRHRQLLTTWNRVGLKGKKIILLYMFALHILINFNSGRITFAVLKTETKTYLEEVDLNIRSCQFKCWKHFSINFGPQVTDLPIIFCLTSRAETEYVIVFPSFSLFDTGIFFFLLMITDDIIGHNFE